MRTQPLIVLAASLVLFCACDKSSAEPAAKQPAAKQATPEPPPGDPPAEKAEPAPDPEPEPLTTAGPSESDEPIAAPTDGVSPVAEGKEPLKVTFGSGASAITVTLALISDHEGWTASFSDNRTSVDMENLCGQPDYGVFIHLEKITKQGYSAKLNSKVVVFHAEHTFDDTGHSEEGPAVFFWRDNKPVCWTGENTAGAERMATGLFEH